MAVLDDEARSGGKGGRTTENPHVEAIRFLAAATDGMRRPALSDFSPTTSSRHVKSHHWQLVALLIEAARLRADARPYMPTLWLMFRAWDIDGHPRPAARRREARAAYERLCARRPALHTPVTR